MTRLRGDVAMVWTLLKAFAERERGTADELSGLLAQGLLPQARLRTHALMGSAATIGAALVARASASLEAAMGAGVYSPAGLQPLREALEASIQSIDGAAVAQPGRNRGPNERR